jgi:hypothetical protein
MATSSNTPESILGRFTYQVLPMPPSNYLATTSKPTQRATAELGSGALGYYLALTVPVSVYATLSNTPWVAQINPGVAPPAIAATSTTA